MLPIFVGGVAVHAAKDSAKSLLSAPMKLSVEEILSMPEINRQVVALKQPQKIYADLLGIAKDSKKNIGVRWKAVTLAAHLDPELAKKDLKPFLKSEEWYMRNAALIGLTSKPGVEAHNIAMSMIQDKALVIRSAAVLALQPSMLSKPDTRETLWGELNASYNYRQKQSLWVRAQILERLALKPESRELPLFVSALQDKDARLAKPAIAALEKISDDGLGRPALLNAKSDLDSKKKIWLKWASNQKAQTIR